MKDLSDCGEVFLYVYVLLLNLRLEASFLRQVGFFIIAGINEDLFVV